MAKPNHCEGCGKEIDLEYLEETGQLVEDFVQCKECDEADEISAGGFEYSR